MPACGDHARRASYRQAGCAPYVPDVSAQIGDGTDDDASFAQRNAGRIGTIVRGGDDRARADLHAVALQIDPRSIGQHDTRPVVAGKHQRPFRRAGGNHYPAGSHVPQALARQPQVGFGQMIGDTLHETNEIVGIPAKCRGARQQCYTGAPPKYVQRLTQPIRGDLAIDACPRLGEQ